MPRKKSASTKESLPKTTSRRTSKKMQTLRGFKDVLPENQKFWNFIYDNVKRNAEDYSYLKIDTPILEDVALFERTIGKASDIISKEMFAFEDKGGDMVVLRPEMTAPVARSYIQHGMLTWPQPVKLWYWGPMFRYDKPQAGRLRQFHQFGFEVIGNDKPDVDAQVILMASTLYKNFGLDVSIQINSIGCPECRQEYIKELKNFLSDKKMCADCQERLKTNPLRVLDCKETKCQKNLVDVPPIIDHLCADCKDHFVKVLEILDDNAVAYVLNPLLVRGLDYYNRTTFEIYLADEDIASQNALGGGGRYDYLIEQIGGRPTPAMGFAGGVERVILKLKDKGIEIKEENSGDVFIAQLGTEAKKKCTKLFNQLRKEGIKVRQAFGKKGLTEQMEEANRLNVKYVLILGQKEILDDTIIVRDMDSGVQEIINFEKTIPTVKKKLLDINSGLRVYNNGNGEVKETKIEE